ncbi:MAG: hypothetical protein H7Z37_15820 [Pyrinomonadaceae bacterium]|nr:hypothetical protein [Pyrinomonadaceae bacterium]
MSARRLDLDLDSAIPSDSAMDLATPSASDLELAKVSAYLKATVGQSAKPLAIPLA